MTMSKSVIQVECIIDGQPAQDAVLRIEQTYVSAEFMDSYQPDPTWTYTDKAGHFHAYTDDLKTPTLETETQTYWCEDCADEHRDSQLVCKLCREEIPPRQRETGSPATNLPGTRTYFLEVTNFTPAASHLDGHSVRVMIAEKLDLFGVMTVHEVSYATGRPSQTTLVGRLDSRPKVRA